MRTKTIALAAGGALALTTLGGVAVAVPTLTAALTPTASEPAEPDDADEADEERLAERTSRIAEELEGLVEDGTLTQAQADAVASTLAEAMPGRGGGPGGHGPGGMGGHGGMGGPGGMAALGGVLREGLATAAETLGVEEDALRERLRDGETLGEVADAEGVARDDLVGALVTRAEELLAEKVAEGDLTQERADEISSELDERITEGLDRSLPGPRGDRPGGPADDDATDEGDS
jgi:polyhydroxyalkanoate synthesis regulator phasin